MEKDLSTEEKIKKIAKNIFQKKGYGNTKTREIAEVAGINLALLNYYFRSKENLFDIVMKESMKEMFSIIKDIINNKNTLLEEKIVLIVNKYIDVIQQNPHLPMFVLREIQNHSEEFLSEINIPSGLVSQSHLYKQIEEIIIQNALNFSAKHVILNIISMAVFPVIGMPIFKIAIDEEENQYLALIEERRQLIPLWIKNLLKMN